MIFDCRRMFTNLCRHTARPPSELCDPLKGRSGDSTLSSSPRAKLRSAELDWGQVLDWKLAAAPSSHSISPISLSLFFFLLSLSLSYSVPVSFYTQPFSLCPPLPSPLSVSHTAAIVPCAFRAAWQLSPGWLSKPMGCSVPLRRLGKLGRSMKKPDASYVKASIQVQNKLCKQTYWVLLKNWKMCSHLVFILFPTGSFNRYPQYS